MRKKTVFVEPREPECLRCLVCKEVISNNPFLGRSRGFQDRNGIVCMFCLEDYLTKKSRR